MAYLNLAQIIGNLGRDPDYFEPEGKQPFANLSVATTRRYRGQDGQTREETEWHRIVVYGTTATNCQRYLRQGSPVYVSGRLRTRKYTDKSGVERYTTEIIAQDVQFLSSGQRDAAPARQAQPAQPAQRRAAPADDFSSDVPF